MDQDSAYIQHVLESIAAIENYLSGKNFDQFTTDKMAQDAVLRNLEIIGEASRNLSEKFRSANLEIDWRQIINMRNKVIHEYFGIDLETVWKTVQEDLPPLKRFLLTKKSL